MKKNRPEYLHNFLGLTSPDSDYERAQYVVWPIPFEQTTTYRRGTYRGPQAILDASREVELFDEETVSEPYLIGIHTLPEMETTALGAEAMVGKIHAAALDLINDGKKIISLGGEHSISAGLVRAYSKKYPRLSVLGLDAHADLRDSYQDSRFSHACAMRRIRESVDITVGVGIRNLSREEHDLVESKQIPLIYAHEMQTGDDWINRALKPLSDDVYLTIDCDFFDPSLVPAVGTPEPGGAQWYPTLALLRELTRRKNIVGFDVVELSPLSESVVSEFTAAKLIYKLIAYLHRESKS